MQLLTNYYDYNILFPRKIVDADDGVCSLESACFLLIVVCSLTRQG